MPAVKGKKKTGRKPATRNTRKKKNQTGFAGFVASVQDGLQKLWSGILTYTAVGLACLAVIMVLMLFAGGYFWNIGDRIENLTGRAAKAVGFEISRVTIKGGENIHDREIMQALWSQEDGSVIGRSLFHMNVKEARARIEAIDWVESAAVQRLWPNTIHISVHQRRPMALWQDMEGRFYLIDRDGARLEQVSSTDHTDLPVVTGTANPASARDMLAALSAYPELFERTAAIVSVKGRRYDLRFRNDFTAMLPEEDIPGALERLDGLGAGTGKLAESLDYIDLRDPKWAYFRPKSS